MLSRRSLNWLTARTVLFFCSFQKTSAWLLRPNEQLLTRKTVRHKESSLWIASFRLSEISQKVSDLSKENLRKVTVARLA